MSAKMIGFHTPPPELLASLGRVMVAHSHLDYTLRMTIKSLADVEFQVAYDATRYDGSAYLREQVRKHGRRRFGESAPQLQLRAILQRCEDVTARRNGYAHAIWGREFEWGRESEGQPMVNTGDQNWRAYPPPDELDALASSIDAVREELNNARLHGWLGIALAENPLSKR